MRCPSCGTHVDADQRYARLIVCAACQSSVVLDARSARLAGKMATLPPTASPLRVGATGTLAGKSFEVLGRVRYGYARGYWDEWFIRFPDGETAWISEDESNLAVEVHEELAAAPVDYATVSPGDAVAIGDHTYHVDEKDVAVCEGGAGQLPFVIQAGARTPFLDLGGDDRFGTLEFALEGAGARFFQGRRIEPGDLHVDTTRSDPAAPGPPTGERRATDDRRERVVKQAGRSQALNCNACGAPLALPDGPAESVTCAHCGTAVATTTRRVTCASCRAVVPIYGHLAAKCLVCPQCRSSQDISGPEPSLLEIVMAPDRPIVPLRLGQRGRLRGVDYVLVGHLRFREREEGAVYVSDEFLLHGRDVGYRWLVLEDGHFSLTEEVDDRPTSVKPRHISPGARFNFQGEAWCVYERGRCDVTWVDGELPWVAAVGDSHRYMDATSPPHLLTAEWTDNEQEWYRATYLSPLEVADAFGLGVRELPRRRGVAAHQPFERSRFRRQALVLVGLTALLGFAGAVYAWCVPGTTVLGTTLAADEYAEEYITRPFAITRSHALCTAEFSAPVVNAWVYLQGAALNPDDEALFEFSAEISYYEGVEGGERWSEGSQRDTVAFRLDEPGEYRLLLKGQAGRGEQAGPASSGPTLSITVREGVILVRYALLLGIACTLWILVEWLVKASFESRRWANSDVEDD